MTDRPTVTVELDDAMLVLGAARAHLRSTLTPGTGDREAFKALAEAVGAMTVEVLPPAIQRATHEQDTTGSADR